MLLPAGVRSSEAPMDVRTNCRRYVTGVREGRYEAWALRMERTFGEQDPQGTPAALLDGEPVRSSTLYDTTAGRSAASPSASWAPSPARSARASGPNAPNCRPVASSSCWFVRVPVPQAIHPTPNRMR